MDVIRGKDSAKRRVCFLVPILLFMVCLISYHKCHCIDKLGTVTGKTGCYKMKEVQETEPVGSRNRERRVLRGLGSTPPRCILRCGKCSPCKPVHVTVPPGMPVRTEYYPEAWRCKCGDRVYMP